MTILKAQDVSEEYTPVVSDLENLQVLEDHIKLSGDGVFHTVQWEGDLIGKPTTFIRLHFCNLKCTFCDSWYTWHKKTKEFYNEPKDLLVSQIHNAVRKAQEDKWVPEEKHVYNVCFTGGEPLIQQEKIEKFMREHPEYSVQIETNGTILPSEYLLQNAKFNCSPKLASSGNKESIAIKPVILGIINATVKPCFKFVCSSEEDIDEVLVKFSFLDRENIYIMPEGVTKEENTLVYEKIIGKIIREGLNTTPRLQNIAFDWAKRGV